MNIEQEVLEKLRRLPRAKQQEVLDFVEFIYQKIQAPVSTGKHNWQEEPFVGLWQDREDLRDSTGWVHNTRQQEWQS